MSGDNSRPLNKGCLPWWPIGKRQEAAADAGAPKAEEKPQLPKIRSTTGFKYFDPAKIHGFERHVETIKSKLLEGNNSTKVVGIVGMGGSGKSTLAKLIFRDPEIQGRYDTRIWVWLSEKIDPGKLDPKSSDPKKPDADPKMIDSREMVKEMLECLNPGSPSSDDLGELLQSLRDRLSVNKYLVVFDNVLRASDWYSDLQRDVVGDDSDLSHGQTEIANYKSRLSYGLPKGTGGAIIVTSTLKDVATQMVGKQNLHEVLPDLDRDSCWKIFEEAIEKKRFVSIGSKVSIMKDEILNRCSGLPLAAKALAEIISFQMLNGKYEALDKIWSNKKKTKTFFLELDLYDDKDEKEAVRIAKTLEGVDGVRQDDPSNPRIFAVKGKGDPIEIANELGRVWPTELCRLAIPQ